MRDTMERMPATVALEVLEPICPRCGHVLRRPGAEGLLLRPGTAREVQCEQEWRGEPCGWAGVAVFVRRQVVAEERTS